MSEIVQYDIMELDYNDLINNVDLTSLIEQAFGIHGTGLLTVKNVPLYIDARSKLLPLSNKFANLSDEVKSKYVHPYSYYSFGWSHGKEKLQGKADLSKGSYYANPQYDNPVEDESIIAKYPSFVHPNIWPSDDLPEFEIAFKELGQIIVDTGKLIARQCDNYIKLQSPQYRDNFLESIIDTSLCCKARLLHYFPINESINNTTSSTNILLDDNIKSSTISSNEIKDTEFSSWCGWHNDHGSLTGLTAAMYIDQHGNQIQNKDKSAGLYIRNRKSELIHVSIPVNNIAFQIGETAQVHSGGLLQATPHAVRGSNIPNISRETFAVFMEPMWMEPMTIPDGVDPSTSQSQSAAENLPPGVPSLTSRWKYNNDTPQTFGEFSELTHQSYY